MLIPVRETLKQRFPDFHPIEAVALLKPAVLVTLREHDCVDTQSDGVLRTTCNIVIISRSEEVFGNERQRDTDWTTCYERTAQDYSGVSR